MEYCGKIISEIFRILEIIARKSHLWDRLFAIILQETKFRRGIKMIEQFTNRYSLQKTLRFSLLPIGKTEEKFNAAVLKQDEQRAEDCKTVKTYIDLYHKDLIESVLSKTKLEGVAEYAALYNKQDKTDDEKKKMPKMEQELRSAIVKALTDDPRYKIIYEKKGKEQKKQKKQRQTFITTEMPKFLETKGEDAEIMKLFKGFSTFFSGYFTNRENMYSPEMKSTAIAYRCINDNLPKFIDNGNSFEKVREVLSAEELAEWNHNFSAAPKADAAEIFRVEYFSSVLAQSGITEYNNRIGGFTCDDGRKIKGLNEYINLYNQQNTGTRLPLMKPLFKQILSDRESTSYIPEKFADDKELLGTVNDFYNSVCSDMDNLTVLAGEINVYDCHGIYIAADSIPALSKSVYGDWAAIRSKWDAEYDRTHKIGKDTKNYEQQAAEYEKIRSFSIQELQTICGEEIDIREHLKDSVQDLRKTCEEKYSDVLPNLTADYADGKRLVADDAAIVKIKAFLDSIKDFEHFAKILLGSGREADKDNVFYSRFVPHFEAVKTIDPLYNKVRNYLTQKPYSTEKIKLTFDNYQLLGGWDINKEDDYRSVLLRKGGNYYLAIFDAENKGILQNAPTDDVDNYEKIICRQIPEPAKYFSKKNMNPQAPPENIKNYLNTTKKELTPQQLEELIRYTAEEFIPNYRPLHDPDENGKCYFDFKIKDYSEYKSWSDFLGDLAPDAYTIKFKDISAAYLDKMIDKGKLYLFQIYNKDFSTFSKGKPNLHTLYFRMLFDEQNLKNVVYKLCGGAEMFYRKPSILPEKATVHPANVPLNNKNPDNAKKQSTFGYVLVKDRRFTECQFSLHLPIMLNFKADNQSNMNQNVREALKVPGKQHIIGIDRGERNLVYACVIDEMGKIVEQKSFNIIESDRDHRVNYHTLLENKSNKNAFARENWQTIESVKGTR